MPRRFWNVAIFCPDAPAGERACARLELELRALNLGVGCHLRQWLFPQLSAFEAAVDCALEADLVILSVSGDGPLPDGPWAVLAEWLIRSEAAASPLAVLSEGGPAAKGAGGELLGALRRLTDRARVPLHVCLGDALQLAWDLWDWKHFPCAAAREETALGGRSDFLFVGKRNAARPRRAACPSGARAGTGGASRHAFTFSRQQPFARP